MGVPGELYWGGDQLPVERQVSPKVRAEADSVWGVSLARRAAVGSGVQRARR